MHQCGFADAGTAGHHHDLGAECRADGLALCRGQFQPRLAFDPGDGLIHLRDRAGMGPAQQPRERGGQGAFGLVQVGQVDQIAPLGIAFLHQRAGGDFVGQGAIHNRLVDVEDARGFGDEPVCGVGAVPVAREFVQGVLDAGARPQRRILGHAHLGGDLVGGLEADAPDVACEEVRVAPDALDGLLAVGLVDPEGAAGGDAVAEQEGHDLADHPLFLPGFLDRVPPLRADTFDFLKAGGAVLDDVEDALAELGHQLLRVHRADVFDQAGAEVLLDALERAGVGQADVFRLELPAVRGVGGPLPVGVEPLARVDLRRGAHQRHRLAPALDLDAQDGEPGLRAVEGDALHRAGDFFQRSVAMERSGHGPTV